LGLRGTLTKKKCPSGSSEEVSFSEAAKRCRPCNLPSLEQLKVRFSELKEGRYWTSDKNGLYRGILVIGRELCEELEDEMSMVGRDVEYINDNVCFTYDEPTSSARFFCVGGGE
jgi:hypothetical protein